MDNARPDDMVEWNIHQMQWVGDANISVVFLLDYILNLETTQALSPSVDEVDDEFPRCCIRAGDFVAFAYNSDPGAAPADD
jgi:hypothetical protein